LVEGYKPAGNNEVEIKEKNLPGGIYFYKIKAGDISGRKK